MNKYENTPDRGQVVVEDQGESPRNRAHQRGPTFNIPADKVFFSPQIGKQREDQSKDRLDQESLDKGNRTGSPNVQNANNTGYERDTNENSSLPPLQNKKNAKAQKVNFKTL